MNLFKLFWKILKDERGFWPLVAGLGAAAMGAGGLMSAFGGEDEEIYDPYAGLRGKWQEWLTPKLGTSTPYKDNPAFNLEQPAVESAAEKNILGYFQNPNTNVADYSEATKKYSEANKASMAETYADERKKTQDMYNRLGLVSSTPGLTAQSDLFRKQATEENLFDTELTYKNLDRQLQAMGFDVSQLNSMLGQAGNMAGAQTGRTQWSKTMSMADLERMLAEEMGYGSLAGGILGGNPPERTLTPDWLSQLGGTLTNIGSLGMTAGILGNRGSSSSGSGISDIGGGNTTNSHYKLVNGKLTYVP